MKLISFLSLSLPFCIFPIPFMHKILKNQHYDALEYRLVGPFRGGRSAAVTGVPNQPNLYYFGATGGGIWKTTDGGRHGKIFQMAILEEVLVPFQLLKVILMLFMLVVVKKP